MEMETEKRQMQSMHKAVVTFAREMCFTVARQIEERNKSSEKEQNQEKEELQRSSTEEEHSFVSYVEAMQSMEFTLNELTDGYVLYHLLHYVDPLIFMAVNGIQRAQSTEPCDANPVETHASTTSSTCKDARNDSENESSVVSNTRNARKRNLLTLIRHMDNYAHSKLHMPYTQSIITACSAIAIAEWGCLAERERHVCESHNINNKNNNNNNNNNINDTGTNKEKSESVENEELEVEKQQQQHSPLSVSLSTSRSIEHNATHAGASQFDVLLSFFVAMMALSGKDEVKRTLQSLSREDQSSLSRSARATMNTYSLHPSSSSTHKQSTEHTHVNENTAEKPELHNTDRDKFIKNKDNAEVVERRHIPDSPEPVDTNTDSASLSAPARDAPSLPSFNSENLPQPTRLQSPSSSSTNANEESATAINTIKGQEQNANFGTTSTTEHNRPLSPTLSEIPSEFSVDKYGKASSPLLPSSSMLTSSSSEEKSWSPSLPMHATEEQRWETSVDPIDADDGYYRNATMQLRRSLAQAKRRITSLENYCRTTLESKESWESKYKRLLRSHAGSVVSSTNESNNVNNTAEDNNNESSNEVAIWRQRSLHKDETIAALSNTIESQKLQLNHFKEATVAHETALQMMKRKLKHVEEELVKRAKDQRDALEKLAVSEDALAIQRQTRVELESQVEQLRSQLTILKVTSHAVGEEQLQQQQQQQQSAHNNHYETSLFGNNDNNNNGSNTLANSIGLNKQSLSSIASTGSIDHVLELEHELDTMRASRDDLQKQVKALERQLTVLPTPVADVTAMMDTYKAQIRRAEKERDEALHQLHNTLDAAHKNEKERKASTIESEQQKEDEQQTERNEPHDSNNDDTTFNQIDNDSNNNTVVDEGIVYDMKLDSKDQEHNSQSKANAENENENTVPIKLSDVARRNETLLSSLLMTYGYDNLLMYQRSLLLRNTHEENNSVNYSGRGAKTAAQQRRGSSQVIDYYNCYGDSNNSNSGSLLTRQRHHIEQGLLDSVINYGASPFDLH